MTKRDWYKCYSGGWKGIIVDEAFAHPAKGARGLAERIYEHALAQGWLEAGQVVVDPFGGIGGFAYHAMSNGLHWVGVELERPFIDTGLGCDCTGISKADWTRFQGRWAKARYLRGRHWCPRCLAQAKAVIEPLPQSSMFDPRPPTTSYERNSGKIPTTAPHHYQGNIEMWRTWGLPGTARLLQGDSRELASVIGQAGGCVTSPPYAEAQTGGGIAHTGTPHGGTYSKTGGYRTDMQQDTPGQLAALPAGDLDAVISSPPWVSSLESQDTEFIAQVDAKYGQLIHRGAGKDYGDNPANLGNLATGDLDAVISSPPYASSLTDGGHLVFRPGMGDVSHKDSKGKDEIYGSDSSNLGNMRANAGDLAAALADGCVTSPPWDSGAPSVPPERVRETSSPKDHGGPGPEYVSLANPANIGNDTGDTFWAAAKTILEQTYQVLRPGAVAIFVVKSFVRNKAIVPFPEQWRDLCESVGFTSLEWIRAWLIEDRGTQFDLWGNGHTKIVKHKSFFRLLTEKKGSPPIDFEIVYVCRKPDGEGQGVDLALSSPPYASSLTDGGHLVFRPGMGDVSHKDSKGKDEIYGTDARNLGNMRATDNDWREAIEA